MNRNHKTLMIGSILLFLMVLTACRSREQAEMLQKFQQIQQAYWEGLERRNYQFVGGARYEEELERYGGAGASISYSLYQSREHPKYAFLQWETNDGSERAYYWMPTEDARSWRTEGWSDNMQAFTGGITFSRLVPL